MAGTGVGWRAVNDVLIEVSLRLVENYVKTTVTEVVSSGNQTVTVGSTGNMYVGAMLVIDSGANAEVVTITALGSGTITAIFDQAHASGTIVWGATFPSQQPTDPIFTQDEMLGYLARAQNEFLSQVPCFYSLFQQQATYNSIFQSLPPTATQLDRVALSTTYIPIASLTRTNNVVTAVTVSPHGLGVGSTPYIYVGPSTPGNPFGEGGFGQGGFGGPTTSDASFQGVFEIVSVGVSGGGGFGEGGFGDGGFGGDGGGGFGSGGFGEGGFGGGGDTSTNFFTYNQIGDDASTDTAIALYWFRLYEVTMSEITMQNRNWRNDYANNPSAFFEDRSGLYQWGLNAPPSSNFPVQLLVATRDSDTLGLLDGFLVPDMCLHYVIYKMLEYVFTKEGVRINPMMAAYCKSRFDRGVATTNRYIDNMLPLKSGKRG